MLGLRPSLSVNQSVLLWWLATQPKSAPEKTTETHSRREGAPTPLHRCTVEEVNQELSWESNCLWLGISWLKLSAGSQLQRESQRNANSAPTSAALGMPGQKPQPSPNVPGGKGDKPNQDLKMTKGKMRG